MIRFHEFLGEEGLPMPKISGALMHAHNNGGIGHRIGVRIIARPALKKAKGLGFKPIKKPKYGIKKPQTSMRTSEFGPHIALRNEEDLTEVSIVRRIKNALGIGVQKRMDKLADYSNSKGAGAYSKAKEPGKSNKLPSFLKALGHHTDAMIYHLGNIPSSHKGYMKGKPSTSLDKDDKVLRKYRKQPTSSQDWKPPKPKGKLGPHTKRLLQRQAQNDVIRPGSVESTVKGSLKTYLSPDHPFMGGKPKKRKAKLKEGIDEGLLKALGNAYKNLTGTEREKAKKFRYGEAIPGKLYVDYHGVPKRKIQADLKKRFPKNMSKNKPE